MYYVTTTYCNNSNGRYYTYLSDTEVAVGSIVVRENVNGLHKCRVVRCGLCGDESNFRTSCRVMPLVCAPERQQKNNTRMGELVQEERNLRQKIEENIHTMCEYCTDITNPLQDCVARLQGICNTEFGRDMATWRKVKKAIYDLGERGE